PPLRSARRRPARQSAGLPRQHRRSAGDEQPANVFARSLLALRRFRPRLRSPLTLVASRSGSASPRCKTLHRCSIQREILEPQAWPFDCNVRSRHCHTYIGGPQMHGRHVRLGYTLAMLLVGATAASAGTLLDPTGEVTGFVPPVRNFAKCERWTSKRAALAAMCIMGCHKKAVALAYRSLAFDEEACEADCQGKYQQHVAV